MKHLTRRAAQKCINILFPRACLFCQREGESLCEDCQAGFEVLEQDFCLCKKPKLLLEPGKCRQCRSKELKGLCFPLFYENPRVKQLIQTFKYKPFLKELAKPLSLFILTYFLLKEQRGFPHFGPAPGNYQNQKKTDFMLVPVPLAKRRLKWRGFNQAEELAKNLSINWGLPLLSDCLIKIKKTPAQTDLSEKERKDNMRGAFSVKNAEKIRSKKILLIDDVYTTGATMEEASRALKKAGAAEVWGVVAARATKI